MKCSVCRIRQKDWAACWHWWGMGSFRIGIEMVYGWAREYSIVSDKIEILKCGRCVRLRIGWDLEVFWIRRKGDWVGVGKGGNDWGSETIGKKEGVLNLTRYKGRIWWGKRISNYDIHTKNEEGYKGIDYRDGLEGGIEKRIIVERRFLYDGGRRKTNVWDRWLVWS